MTLKILSLLWDIHFGQLLVVVLGASLYKLLLPQSVWSTTSRTLAITVLGVGFVAVLGILRWIIGIPTSFLWIVILLCALYLARSLRDHLSLRKVWFYYSHVCLLPFFIFAGYALFLFSHFNADEFEKGMEPWALADRVSTYHVPDHILQWQISENLKREVPLETGFRRHRATIWSAGDRPLLIGFVDATLGALTGAKNLDHYFLRIVFWASLLLFALSGLLKEDFRIPGRWRVLILAGIWLQPFFLSNALYTWPKSAGLAFGVICIYFLLRALKSSESEKNQQTLYVSAFTASVAVLCHSAAVYCLVAIVPLVLLTIGWPKLPKAWTCAVSFLIFITPLALHEWYVTTNTRPTHLLPRIQLCRNGSYAFPTPVVSLYEACKDYFEKEGLSGVIADRVESFRFGFLVGYEEFFTKIQTLSSSDFLMWWYKESLAQPVITYGLLSLPFLLVSILIYVRSSREESPALACGITGLILLVLFCCTMGEYSEMRSHVVPYIIPLLLTLMVLLSAYEFGSFWRYLIVFYVLINGILLLPRVEFMMTPWFGFAGLALVLFGTILENSVDETFS